VIGQPKRIAVGTMRRPLPSIVELASLDGREEVFAIHELAIRHFQVQAAVCAATAS